MGLRAGNGNDLTAAVAAAAEETGLSSPPPRVPHPALHPRLLGEKRQELLDQASKLRTGLFKIDETREKVEVMSLELEEAKKKVAEFQRQCEEYLVIIVQQKREADEQQKVGGFPGPAPHPPEPPAPMGWSFPGAIRVRGGDAVPLTSSSAHLRSLLLPQHSPHPCPRPGRRQTPSPASLGRHSQQ